MQAGEIKLLYIPVNSSPLITNPVDLTGATLALHIKQPKPGVKFVGSATPSTVMITDDSGAVWPAGQIAIYQTNGTTDFPPNLAGEFVLQLFALYPGGNLYKSKQGVWVVNPSL